MNPVTQAAPGAERAEAVLDAEQARHGRAARHRRVFLATGRVGLVVVVLLGWQLLSGPVIEPFFVSSPQAVIERLVEWTVSGELWYHAQFTLVAAFCGYLLGVVLGVLVAWPLGLMPVLYRIGEPYFLVAYSIPAVAMAPVFILWFGIGMTPKILIAAYFVFFLVFINTVAGFRMVPAGLLEVTRVMGAGRVATLRTVILPSALSYVLAALRITLPAAMIGAVTGEFIASNRGLGYLTRSAAAGYSTAGVLAGVTVLAALVLLMNLLLRPLKHALRWQQRVPVTGAPR